MTPIIAGRFEDKGKAEYAAEALRQRGFAAEEVTVFYSNPRGQHATSRVGGERDMVRGAYLGSLASAQGGSGHSDSAATETGEWPETPDDAVPMPRRVGFIVAARATEYARRVVAANVLQSVGAKDVERADGTWKMGKWTDFDPLQSPKLVDLPPSGRGPTQR
ncbi:MAG: hypothetical protein ABI900_13395 [Betaproteobacteria bacterium]